VNTYSYADAQESAGRRQQEMKDAETAAREASTLLRGAAFTYATNSGTTVESELIAHLEACARHFADAERTLLAVQAAEARRFPTTVRP
jgi:hypothetical protein